MTKKKKVDGRRKEPTRSQIRRLGRVTDRSLAAEAMVSVATVKRWRDDRDIKALVIGLSGAERVGMENKLRAIHSRTGASLRTASRELGITYEQAKYISGQLDLKWAIPGRPAGEETTLQARAAYVLRSVGFKLSEIRDLLKLNNSQRAHQLVGRGKKLAKEAAETAVA